jgi:hypothetical protein
MLPNAKKKKVRRLFQIFAPSSYFPQLNKRGVSHCGLAIYIKKGILKAKEELWKFKYFTMQKI